MKVIYSGCQLCKGDLLKRSYERSLQRPCLVWLSWLGITPASERMPVRFPVGARTWVAGSPSPPCWGVYETQPINVSLSHQCFSLLFLRPFFSKNKSNLYVTKAYSGVGWEQQGPGRIPAKGGEVKRVIPGELFIMQLFWCVKNTNLYT